MVNSVSAQNNVTPQTITSLSAVVNESSGLLNLDGELWTHNDSGGLPALYRIDPQNGSVIKTVQIENATNVDWEDLAADYQYVYIGDFGNNYGNRTNLKIYRISRVALDISTSVPAETISFSYSDQTSWDPHLNQNDYDCEAFISFNGSLYLFSKDWVDHKTRVYQLSSQPGTYVAQYMSTFNAQGLVTAAGLLPSGVLVLQGYTTTLTPFTWILQQFPGDSFFLGTNTRLNWTNIAQTEGISYGDNNGVYVTSEKAPNPLPFVATLFYLNISAYILPPPDKTLNLTVFLEGLYAGNRMMNKARDENGDHFPGNTADQVAIELHKATNFQVVEYSTDSVNLGVNGNAVITPIPGTLGSYYYISVKHRNSIETVSAVPVSFAGNTISYDFSNSASKAFDSNLVNWNGTGVYAIWGGDVNQDGIIDSGDMNPVDNASTAIGFGYLAEDVNGDGIVDAGDMNLVDNNSTALIQAMTP